MSGFELPGMLQTPLRAGLAGVVLLAGGCTAKEVLPEPTPVVQQEHRGPCEVVPLKGGGDTSYIEPDDANRCASYMQDGTVYVVNFGVDGGEAQGFADRMRVELKIASKGLLSMGVNVVEASPAAKEALNRLAPGGCLNSEHAAAAADTAMPELDEDAIKVALSPVPACEKGLRARSDNGGEYVDVYWGLLNPDNKEYRVAEGAMVGMHELLHNLKLGHKGRIFLQDPTSGQLMLFSGQKLRQLDIPAYLRQSIYSEYGNDPANLMSSPALNGDYLLDPIHLNKLRWPQIALQGQQVSNERLLQTGEVELSLDDVEQSRFVTVHLQEGVSLRDLSLPQDQIWGRDHYFDQLSFRPLISADDGSIAVVELYLGNAENNLASFGVLGIDAQPTTVTFGSQKFVISVNNGQFRVAAL